VTSGVYESTPLLFWGALLPFEPSIDPAIWEIAPGFRALSLKIQLPRVGNQTHALAQHALDEAIAAVHAGKPSWADAHMSAWAETFRHFGAKPQRTPCSAQSLRDRVLKTGTLGAINPVVDLYNAVSLKFAVPVGGENARAYVGSPRLVVADGTENFDTMKNGVAATESPVKGEVVWRDDTGVTCRIWNWRQGVRTRIDADTTDMWFVLESLPEMPLDALEEAGAALLNGLNAMFGETVSEQKLLRQE
jgi:DNA/RNA-binding domain of Phe-tRNA-synthetase-like protein